MFDADMLLGADILPREQRAKACNNEGDDHWPRRLALGNLVIVVGNVGRCARFLARLVRVVRLGRGEGNILALACHRPLPGNTHTLPRISSF